MNFKYFTALVAFATLLHTGFAVNITAPAAGAVPIGDKFYTFDVTETANFFEAFAHCARNGLRLATIENKEVNDLLVDYIQDTYPSSLEFWTSGNNLADSNTWVWLSSGEPVTYTNWQQGRNPRGDQSCLEISYNNNNRQWEWVDTPCHIRLYHICESSN